MVFAKFIERARELKSKTDRQLTYIYCNIIDSADLDKYEWRIFQDRDTYIRDILSHEFAG
jgi:hypothetical protein